MKNCLLLPLAVVLLVPAVSFGSPPAVLTKEQSLLAKRMEAFMDRMEVKFLDAVSRLNGSQDLQTKTFQLETQDSAVKVARGPVVEKGAYERTTIKKELPPMLREPLWSRFMSIDIWPKTPLVGLLHANLYFVYYKDGSTTVGAIMDIVPATLIEDDLTFARAEMDKLFAKHGVAIEPFREALLNELYRRLRSSGVGVSFFVKPPFLQINEENFNLVKESFETLFDSYIKILEKRKDQKFTEKDVGAMFDMRRRLLEKNFFFDPFSSTGLVPYEVWSFESLPPEVRF